MIHAFLLGPVETGQGSAWCVAGVTPDGDMVSPELRSSPEKALEAFAKRGGGQEIVCEPALAELAGPLGLRCGKLTQEALPARAALAYLLSRGPMAGKPPPDALFRLFHSCAAFLKARPWERVDSDTALPTVVTIDARRSAREVSILGGGGEEFGVAIYDQPGSIQRVLAAMEAGRPEDGRHVDSLSVTLDEEPEWAVEALDAAFGLGRLPFPVRLRRGRPSPASTEELLQLAAVLDAVVKLTSGGAQEEAEASAQWRGLRVTARVGPGQPLALPDIEELAEPMLVPEPRSGELGERVPRNAPCPCGSGRKYKECHLAEDQRRAEAARGTGLEAEEARATQRRMAERDPVHNLDERIHADAMALAKRRWGRAFDPEGALATMHYDFQASQMVSGWASAHYPGPDGRTALDLYLEERGGALDDLGRRLVEAQREAWFSLHLVKSVEPGVSITLQDLLAGSEATVQEKSGSRTIPQGHVIMARVLDLGDRAILAGNHPRSLPPLRASHAVESIRKAIRARGVKVSASKLREATARGVPLVAWQALVEQVDAQPLPRLQNTDGEPFLLTVDRFEVATAGTEAVHRGLLAMPNAVADEPEDGESGFVVRFEREGNAKGALPSTLIGRAVLEEGRLRIESNSVERADRLRKAALERCGAALTFRIREHTDPAAFLRDAIGKGAPSPPEPMPPEVRATVRRLMEEHYRRWLDEPVPALGGLTPREAAKRKGAKRRKLELLLVEIEAMEAGKPAGERFDVAVLRRELGGER
jgi:hypothetical protein